MQLTAITSNCQEINGEGGGVQTLKSARMTKNYIPLQFRPTTFHPNQKFCHPQAPTINHSSNSKKQYNSEPNTTLHNTTLQAKPKPHVYFPLLP
mmetsp:Transcript_20643/g.24798  ORF Transcript_20643/g.24798 Transcript_20643/m.24798 type:complete len:94 (-) Transcript_20643:1408-1689(-)